MMAIILSIVLVITLIVSISIVIEKRKRAGITSIKSLLASICLYLIAIVNLLAYWFNFLGIISRAMTIILLILGSYFTKYIPITEKKVD